jgi:hypothetical protein
MIQCKWLMDTVKAKLRVQFLLLLNKGSDYIIASEEKV